MGNRPAFQIKTMMPVTGWRAWRCRFYEGKPQIEELSVPCLAVVRYAEDESDTIEPCIQFDNIMLPERNLRKVMWDDLYSNLYVCGPLDVFDKDNLISDTRSNLRVHLAVYAQFEKEGFSPTTAQAWRDAFAASRASTVQEWAHENWVRWAWDFESMRLEELGACPSIPKLHVTSTTRCSHRQLGHNI